MEPRGTGCDGDDVFRSQVARQFLLEALDERPLPDPKAAERLKDRLAAIDISTWGLTYIERSASTLRRAADRLEYTARDKRADAVVGSPADVPLAILQLGRHVQR